MQALGISKQPQNFLAAAIYSLQIDLSWQSPADTGGFSPDNSLIKYYLVQYSSNTSFDVPYSIKVKSCTGIYVCLNSYSIYLLTENVKYFFRVYAVTDAGSGLSSAVLVAIPMIPSLLSSVIMYNGSNLTGGGPSSLSISITTFTPNSQVGYIALSALGFFGLENAIVNNPFRVISKEPHRY